jgi:hypothetical protein
MITMPTEEARGSVMAKMPQMIMKMPQIIDHPLAFLTEPRVVSEFIFKTARLPFGDYGVGDEVVSLDPIVGDSVVVELVVVSEEGVGLAAGVAVSVFFSHAASIPAARTMQMYFVMGRF